METRTYLISDFLTVEESFHFTRRTMVPGEPGYMHSHDFHELLVVEDGSLAHTVNGHSRPLQTGHALFVRPPDVHAIRVANDSPCRVVNVIFRSEIADHLLTRYRADLSDRYYWCDDEVPASYALTPDQLSRFASVASDLQRAPRTLSQIESFLLTLTTRIIALPPYATPTIPPWLLTAVEASKQPDVFRDGAAGFVRAAGRGHEHVCRKTREHLGVTPSALINNVRMEYAAHLLVDENLSVSEVAEAVGIDNMSHFYRVFRQHHGVTPKVYRRQHQRSPF